QSPSLPVYLPFKDLTVRSMPQVPLISYKSLLFHGGDTGSIPVWDANFLGMSYDCQDCRPRTFPRQFSATCSRVIPVTWIEDQSDERHFRFKRESFQLVSPIRESWP